MATTSQQHHHLARQRCLAQRGGHADVFGDLYARHQSNLIFRQQVAVPDADQLLLCLERRAGQLVVQLGVAHGTAHGFTRHVGADHRHASAYRRHDGRPISLPWPGFVVPFQGRLRLQFSRAGMQRSSGRPCVGHFKRHRTQQAPLRQHGDDLSLNLLVFGRVMLLAQQQYIGGQQGIQPGTGLQHGRAAQGIEHRGFRLGSARGQSTDSDKPCNGRCTDN